jgi:hypothetical protein
MANFGVRLAYPHATPPRRAARAVLGARSRARLAARLRRAVDGMLRAIDDAPYGLAWPGSPSGLSRPAWQLPAERPAPRPPAWPAGAGAPPRRPPARRRRRATTAARRRVSAGA